jgi:lysophospholipase L1-like esterase
MKRTSYPMAIVCFLCLFLSARAEDAAGFFFREGDRIVFLGDSITEQYQYSSCIELYLTTRFPKWNLTFFNAGIGGDTATGGARRFADHVLAEKPTAVTINFGMNDAGYGAFNESANRTYLRNTEAMLAKAAEAGVRVALLSPNAVDRRIQDRFRLYLETQKQFYAPLRELASKYKAAFVDQYATTRTALERMEADSATTVKPFGDGFHTSPAGGLLMAYAILTGLHAPAIVSNLTVDLGSGAVKAEGCKVELKKDSQRPLAFIRTDEALPLPVQKDWFSLLPYINQLKDLNWYGLTVTGLSPGRYTLQIDDAPVAEFSAEELARGVNLGNLTKGPIYEQSRKVFDAINSKNKLVHQRFRGVVMFQIPDWLADVAVDRRTRELAQRWEKIAERQAEVYRLAQPVAHRFELLAVKEN